MSKHFIIILFFLLSSTQILAQNLYFERGYIVKDQDTISGFINRTEEAKLSLGISFKADSAAKDYQSLAAGEVSGFGFRESQLHFRPVEVSLRTSNGRETSIRFAKLLLDGTVSLYQLHLSEAEERLNYAYTFIFQRDISYYTLSQYALVTDQKSGVDKRYRGTLNALLSDCPILKSEINNLPYRPVSIAGVIKKYNTHCSSNPTVIEYSHKVKPLISQGPVVAVGTYFTPSLNNFLDNKVYSIGYFIDYQNPEISRLISFQSGINYMRFYNSYQLETYDGSIGSWKTETIKKQEHAIRIPLLFQLNFNTGLNKNIKPFLRFGLNGQAYFHKDPKRTEYVPFFNAGTGFYYRNIMFSLQVDSKGFFFKSDKLVLASLGWRVGNWK